MTLIASFYEDGCPVLFGDLLTSGPGDQSLNELPFWQRTDVNIEVEGGSRLLGTAQKVVVISDRLCLAWAGPVFRAEAFIRHLREAEKTNPSGSLIGVFFSYPEEDRRGLEFVAYAREGEGFRHFHTVPPIELGPFTQLRYDGSGGRAFYDNVSRMNITRPAPDGPDFNFYNAWVIRAWSIIGSLISQQRATGAGLAEGWGGGFELAFYDGDRFRKTDKILYLEWDFREVTSNRYVISILEPYVFQWTIDEKTIFYSETPGQRNLIHVVAPPWGKNDPLPFSLPAPPMTFEPNYIVNIIQGRHLDGNHGFGSFVRSVLVGQEMLARIKTDVRIAGSPEPKTTIELLPSFLEEVVNSILPPNGTVHEVYFMGARAPWPPPPLA